MTGPKMLQVVKLYLVHLAQRGAVRSVGIDTGQKFAAGYEQDVRDHLAWMLFRIQDMATHNDRETWEKANRWLGFVQGCLFMLGDFSIDEMRDQTRETGDKP